MQLINILIAKFWKKLESIRASFNALVVGRKYSTAASYKIHAENNSPNVKRFLSIGDHIESTTLNLKLFDIGGISVKDTHFFLDVTQVPPVEIHSKYELIWSERMLEHIPTDKIPSSVYNISKLLTFDGILRFSLPICYFVEGHMLREGNYQRQIKYGHFTWFNIESYGEITKEIFGNLFPLHHNSRPWNKVIEGNNLFFRPIRHFDRDGNLFVNNKIFNEDKNIFKDYPDIKQKRPNSFIFDLSLSKFS